MFDDPVLHLDPPPNRRAMCTGDKESHLTEAAVMLAYGMHLLRTVPTLSSVELHPDREHAKHFEIARWLSAPGFALKESYGKTAYSGIYAGEDQTIIITSSPGKATWLRIQVTTVLLRSVCEASSTRSAQVRSRVCEEDYARPWGFCWHVPEKGVRSRWCRIPTSH